MPRFEFTNDRAHLAEHWSETVVTLLPNLRSTRNSARLGLGLGALAFGLAWPFRDLTPTPAILGVALFVFGLSLYSTASYLLRHAAWLKHARSSPRFGQTIQMVI